MNLTRLGDQPICVMCAWPDAQWRFVIGRERSHSRITGGSPLD